MNIVLTLLGVTLFPVATMAMLMWLTHLEETLPVAVRSAQHSPAPPPILTMPVTAPVAAPVSAVADELDPRLPQQRTPAPTEVPAAG